MRKALWHARKDQNSFFEETIRKKLAQIAKKVPLVPRLIAISPNMTSIINAFLAYEKHIRYIFIGKKTITSSYYELFLSA